MNTPENLRYTPSDEWVRAESDGTVTVGISDYAQHELGELVYVELPEVGRQLQAGQMFGVVESVKAVGELLLPVLGEVVEINDAVTEDPTLINNSPYEDGWLVKVRTEAGF
ncbi:MAG TPA: glycine cleavage system protein GcvH, partial [Abditibacterium sp.]